MTPNTHTIEPGTYLQASGKNTITSSAFKYGSAKAHAPGRATTRAPQRCSSVLLKWSAQAMYECTHTCSKRNVVTCWDNPKKKVSPPQRSRVIFRLFLLHVPCRGSEHQAWLQRGGYQCDVCFNPDIQSGYQHVPSSELLQLAPSLGSFGNAQCLWEGSARNSGTENAGSSQVSVLHFCMIKSVRSFAS